MLAKCRTSNRRNEAQQAENQEFPPETGNGTERTEKRRPSARRRRQIHQDRVRTEAAPPECGANRRATHGESDRTADQQTLETALVISTCAQAADQHAHDDRQDDETDANKPRNDIILEPSYAGVSGFGMVDHPLQTTPRCHSAARARPARPLGSRSVEIVRSTVTVVRCNSLLCVLSAVR